MQLKVKQLYAVKRQSCPEHWTSRLRSMVRHLPYVITQCYLPPDTS